MLFSPECDRAAARRLPTESGGEGLTLLIEVKNGKLSVFRVVEAPTPTEICLFYALIVYFVIIDTADAQCAPLLFIIEHSMFALSSVGVGASTTLILWHLYT